MRVSIVASVVLVVVLAGSVLGAAATGSTATASDPASTPSVQTTQPAVDDGSMLESANPAQEIRINVTESGDAVWTIESRFLLSDEGEVEAFLEYAETASTDEDEGVYDRSLFEPHVETAADATDREMTIEDAGWDDPQLRSADDGSNESGSTVGVLSYSFTWTEFAAVDGTQIHVGDAFQSDDGPWLSALAEEQRLVIQAPSDHGFHDYNLSVSPQDSALIVDGPHQFDEDELEATFLRGADDGSSGGADFYPASAELLFGGVFVLAILIGTGSYALARWSSDSEWSPALWVSGLLPSNAGERTGGGSPPTGRDDPSSASERDAELGAVDTDDSRDADSTPPVDARESSGQTFAYAEESGADGTGEAVDPELLSDEERVLRLLRRNGGRMKQGSIVSETGWSNAKVSQLLSQMADDEEIEKLRIGRENLITLPEVDPTELG
ncbi:ABC transporter permease [Natronococcus sp. A-GB1]|uniref:helix-turn-helix transcriptional regulator n=1 Tax=Natronococcus sp. A-GB1 TaxID=3037648 RepID=UPI00241D06FB|nr:ABC transporter permease [Natronococcus sp. A-GB1]MDG5760701.1 ABC transporter permease [Natronococcus sp. A-GB1]